MTDEEPLRIESRDAVTVATVRLAEVTSAVTDVLLAWLSESLEAGSVVKLVVDLSSVKFIDSVALGAMVVVLRRVKQTNGRLALVGLSGHSLRVLQVTGLEKVFDLYADLPTALEAVQRPV